ncbi:MAG: hypothetical protein ACR2O6_13600 [Ilumatobacteraceae bacterium]
MTENRQLDSASGDDDPWAPGGAMSRTPIPAASVFFEPAAERATDTDVRQPSASGSTGDSGVPAAGVPPRGLLASKWARIAAIAVAVLVAVAGVVTIARDDGAEEPVAEPEPTVATTNAPAVSTSTPDPDPSEDESVGPSNELLVGGTYSGSAQLVEIPVELPSVLDDIAPTEIIVLGSRGQMYQVTTSTRRARSLTLIEDDRSRFAATDDTVVVWNELVDTIAVLRRGRDPIELPVDPGVAAVIAEADGEFLLAPEDEAGSRWRELRVDPVIRTAELDVEAGAPWTVRPHPGGDLMVSTRDGGGTALLGPDGPTAISSGLAVGTGRNHVLYRECDADRTCTYALEDLSGERTEPPGLTGLDPTGPVDIAPDGGALVRLAVAEDGAVELSLVDVQTGESTVLPVEPGRQTVSPVHWTPDGRGLFAISGTEVVFVDRETGEVTPVPGIDALLAGDPLQIATRPAPAPSVEEGSIVVTLTGLTGLDLVALAPDGDVVRIDIDGRATVTYEGQPLLSGAPAYVLPDATGVTVVSSENVPGFRLDYGGTPMETESEPFSGRILPGPGLSGESFWQVPDHVFGETELTLVDASGAPAADPIVVSNAFVLGSDGTGSVLVYTAGADYVIGASGAVRLTDGEVLAVGAAAAYARECDEVLACGIVRIDRATGARTPVAVPELERATADPAGLSTFGQTVSPDGDVAFVQLSVDSLTWSLVDVVAGTALEVPGPGRGTPIVWSDDSQYAIYVSGDILQLYDRAAGVVKDLSQLPRIKTFTEFVPPVAQADVAADGGGVDGFRGGEVVPKSFRR